MQLKRASFGVVRTLRMLNVCECAVRAPQVSDCTTARTLRNIPVVSTLRATHRTRGFTVL